MHAMATDSQPRRPQSVRLFGYDIFISFALGPPPRGCRSYASDLARRLRERDFTVFFSEDEAPVGAELDQTLKRAVHRSRVLVVIANRGTLADPRWVRAEVEEFRRRHPDRPVVPISIDGALQDPDVLDQVGEWLPFRDRIWIDESRAAAEAGAVSDDVVARLATAPSALRSAVRWRVLVAAVFAFFAVLAVFSSVMGIRADRSARAEAQAAQEARVAQGNATQAAASEALAASAARAAEREARNAAAREAEAASAARAAKQLAEQQRDIAVARQRGAQAELMRTQQPDRQPLAMLLAMESLHQQPDSIEAQLTLRRLLAATPRPVSVLAQGDTVSQVAFSRDGALLAGAGAPAGRLWATVGWASVAALPGANRHVLFSPDGQRIAGCCNEVGVWSRAGQQELALGSAALGGEAVHIVFSPDGRRLAIGVRGARPGFVVYDLQTRQPARRHAIDLSGNATAIAFGNDGRLYFAPRESIEVHVGPELALAGQMEPAIGAVRLLTIDPRGRFLAASSGRRVAVFDLSKPGAPPVRLESAGSGPGDVQTLAFDASGSHLAAIGGLDTGSVWRTADWRQVLRVTHQEFATIETLAFDPTAPRVTSCASDGNCFVWSLRSGEQLQRFSHAYAHSGRDRRHVVAGSAFAPQRAVPLLATGGTDGTLRLWDLAPFGSSPGSRQACARDDYRIRTFAPNGLGWYWEANTWVASNRGCRPVPAGVAGALSTVPEGTIDAAVLPGDRVRTSRRGSKQIVATLVHDQPVDWDAVLDRLKAQGMTSNRAYLPAIEEMQTRGSVRVEAVSPSGRWIMTYRDADRRLRLWDTESQRVSSDEPADGGTLRWIRFVSDSRLLRLDRGGQLSLRRVPEGTTLWSVDVGAVNALALSADSGRLAWAASRPEARLGVIDVADGRTVLIRSPPHPAGELLFMGAGRFLVALNVDGSVPEGLPLGAGLTLLDLSAGTATLTLDRAEQVIAVAASNDDRRFAALGRAGDLRLWDPASGRLLAKTVVADVGPLAFSARGDWLAAGRTSIVVLKTGTLQPVSQVDLVGEARLIEFDADGRQLAVKRFVNNEDAGTVELHDWRSSDLLAEACRRLPSDAVRQWRQLLPGQAEPRVCRGPQPPR